MNSAFILGSLVGMVGASIALGLAQEFLDKPPVETFQKVANFNTCWPTMEGDIAVVARFNSITECALTRRGKKGGPRELVVHTPPRPGDPNYLRPM